MQPNDLVLVKPPAREDGGKVKPVLIRVSKIVSGSPQRAFGYVEKLLPRQQSTVEFPVTDVVMNLGSDPFPGTVHGYNLHYRYRRTVEIEHLGEVYLFCKVAKEEIKELRSAAEAVFKKLHAKKLNFLLNGDTDFEIVSKEYAGKWAGMYSHSKDPEKHPHRIQVTLDKKRLEESSITTYAYVLAHELGHALHFQYVKRNPKADAAWVRAYTETVTPVQVEKTTIKAFLNTLLSTGSVGGARGEIGEDELPMFRRVLREVQASAGLSARELDLLLSAERQDAVEAAWPKSGLMHPEMHPSITQYALKNYKELFAETFAFWLLGKKIPANLLELMEKSATMSRRLLAEGP